MGIVVHTKFLNGRKQVSGIVPSFQQRLQDFMVANLQDVFKSKNVTLAFELQTNGKTSAKIVRQDRITGLTYLITFPLVGLTPDIMLDRMAYLYGCIRSFEIYQTWTYKKNYQTQLVDLYTKTHGNPTETDKAQLIALSPVNKEAFAPAESKLTIRILDGRKVVSEHYGAKLIKSYDKIIAQIKKEVEIIRKQGITSNATFSLQLKPKVSNGGLFKYVTGSNNIEIIIQITKGKYVGRTYKTDDKNRTEIPLSKVLFVLKHECGHWQHYALKPESAKWSSKRKEQWAHSYAYWRGSNPKHYESKYGECQIVSVGLPVALQTPVETTRPADLPDLATAASNLATLKPLGAGFQFGTVTLEPTKIPPAPPKRRTAADLGIKPFGSK